MLTKCSKCNTFQVTSDVFNSENLKLSIAQLCNQVPVCNFTRLYPTQKWVNNVYKQEGQRCPKRQVAQAAIRLATAVIKFRNKEKKC